MGCFGDVSLGTGKATTTQKCFLGVARSNFLIRFGISDSVGLASGKISWGGFFQQKTKRTLEFQD